MKQRPSISSVLSALLIFALCMCIGYALLTFLFGVSRR